MITMQQKSTPANCLSRGKLGFEAVSDLGLSCRALNSWRFSPETSTAASSSSSSSTFIGSCKQEADLSVTTPQNVSDPFYRPHTTPASMASQAYSSWPTAGASPHVPHSQDVQAEQLHAVSASCYPCARGYGYDWPLRARHQQSSPFAAPEMGGAFPEINSFYYGTARYAHCQSAGSNMTTSSEVTDGIKLPQRRGAMQLWEFLLEQLDKEDNSHVIHWVDKEALTFQFSNPEEVAKRWGEVKCRPRMNYDNLCRSLRYYYQKKFLTKVHTEQYVYKFLCHPSILQQALQGRKRQHKDTAKSPANTPPVISYDQSPEPEESQNDDKHPPCHDQWNGEPPNQRPSCQQEILVKTEPVDDFDFQATAYENSQQPWQYKGNLKDLPNQHAVVVKQEQDFEMTDGQFDLTHDMKIPPKQEAQMTLWQFLLDMLYTGNQSIVCWRNMAEKEFQIINPAELARHWSAITGHPQLTYEDINYLLQYYCETNLLIRTEKYTFQFLSPPPELNGDFYGRKKRDKMSHRTYKQLEFIQFGSDSISSSSNTPEPEDNKLFMTQLQDGIKTDMPYSLPYLPTNHGDIKPHKKSVCSLPFISGFPLMSQITSDLIDMEMLVTGTTVSKTRSKVDDDWGLAYSPKRRRTSHGLGGSQ